MQNEGGRKTGECEGMRLPYYKHPAAIRTTASKLEATLGITVVHTCSRVGELSSVFRGV